MHEEWSKNTEEVDSNENEASRNELVRLQLPHHRHHHSERNNNHYAVMEHPGRTRAVSSIKSYDGQVSIQDRTIGKDSQQLALYQSLDRPIMGEEIPQIKCCLLQPPYHERIIIDDDIVIQSCNDESNMIVASWPFQGMMHGVDQEHMPLLRLSFISASADAIVEKEDRFAVQVGIQFRDAVSADAYQSPVDAVRINDLNWSTAVYVKDKIVFEAGLNRRYQHTSKIWISVELEKGVNSNKLTKTAKLDEFPVKDVLTNTRLFYERNTQIKASHGVGHVMKVYQHALKAIACHVPRLPRSTQLQIQAASLLHDVDDCKYFPNNSKLDNARSILQQSNVPSGSVPIIIHMIELVSCSKNGNSVPEQILNRGMLYLLIPRWSDRLEAVGAIGVVRCYQYSVEHNRPLSSAQLSPRAQSVEEIWELAEPERFERYQRNGGESTDMISHYYDKLLHVSRPPVDLVRNFYLERMAEASSQELVEMCLRYGRTGAVDTGYVEELANKHNLW